MPPLVYPRRGHSRVTAVAPGGEQLLVEVHEDQAVVDLDDAVLEPGVDPELAFLDLMSQIGHSTGVQARTSIQYENGYQVGHVTRRVWAGVGGDGRAWKRAEMMSKLPHLQNKVGLHLLRNVVVGQLEELHQAPERRGDDRRRPGQPDLSRDVRIVRQREVSPGDCDALKPQIGHNVGFQAPISTRSACAPSSV